MRPSDDSDSDADDGPARQVPTPTGMNLKLGKLNLDDQLSQMRAGLASAEAERDRVKGLYDGLAGAGANAAGRATELGKALDSEKQPVT